MNLSTRHNNRRLLLIDDNRAIHDDFHKILAPPAVTSSLDDIEAALFGSAQTAPARPHHHFEIDSAFQGVEGLELVKQARAEGRPYAMAFVDMRMPPGWDGLQTTKELWKIEPDLQVVICTAYSDYSWEELLAQLGGSDQLVILKKPFDPIEVLQLANALTEKWNLLQAASAQLSDLESAVRARTAQLEEANRRLRDEIAEHRRTEAALLRAKETAESATRAKSAFLANMSHEIRTPMNGVIGMANLLLGSELGAEQRELARMLCQSGEILLAIINDILDLSKIEAGKLTLETLDFNLTDIVKGVLELQQEPAMRKGVSLTRDIAADVPAWVRGDPVRLRQILLNLVGNAIKFTPEGDVVVRLRLERATAPTSDSAQSLRVRFEVIDQGIGIATEVQKQLFQPFTQADNSTTRKFGGTGLGLAIVKRLVELMGGEVGVESMLGQGSTFWVVLPFATAAAAPADGTVIHVDLARYRAIVLSRDSGERKRLQHVLRGILLQNDPAASGGEALAMLAQAATLGRPYDLVVIDQSAPDMSAPDLASAIHGEELPAPPKIVWLTSDETQPGPACAIDAQIPRHAQPATLRQRFTEVLLHHRPAESGPSIPGPARPNELPILLVEDNPVNQKIALLQLRRLGYTADVASDGAQAIAALRQKRYRVVLMDSQMPQMDGLTATRHIRAAQVAGDPGMPADLRIIAMTANAMTGDRDACLAAGMDDYIAKPVRLEFLKAAIERATQPEPAAARSG